jgi:hypothetical protein
VAGTEAAAGDRGAVGSFRSSAADQPGDDLSVVVCAAARGAARAADCGVADRSKRQPPTRTRVPGNFSRLQDGKLSPRRAFPSHGAEFGLELGFGACYADLVRRRARGALAAEPWCAGVRSAGAAPRGAPRCVAGRCRTVVVREGPGVPRGSGTDLAHRLGRLSASRPVAPRALAPPVASRVPRREHFKHRDGAKSARLQERGSYISSRARPRARSRAAPRRPGAPVRLLRATRSTRRLAFSSLRP